MSWSVATLCVFLCLLYLFSSLPRIITLQNIEQYQVLLQQYHSGNEARSFHQDAVILAVSGRIHLTIWGDFVSFIYHTRLCLLLLPLLCSANAWSWLVWCAFVVFRHRRAGRSEARCLGRVILLLSASVFSSEKTHIQKGDNDHTCLWGLLWFWNGSTSWSSRTLPGARKCFCFSWSKEWLRPVDIRKSQNT